MRELDVRTLATLFTACAATAVVELSYPGHQWHTFMLSVLALLIIDRARLLR
jgi:hypothetical protein